MFTTRWTSTFAGAWWIGMNTVATFKKNTRGRSARRTPLARANTRRSQAQHGGAAVLSRRTLPSPQVAVIPQYTRKVLFSLSNVSSTDPTVAYSDLLSVEGKTAGYTAARFKAARVIAVGVWKTNQNDPTHPNSDDSSVGLWLKEGPSEDAYAPVGYDVGTWGAESAAVKASAGLYLSSAWDSTGSTFMQVRTIGGSPVDSADFSKIWVEVTASFR